MTIPKFLLGLLIGTLRVVASTPSEALAEQMSTHVRETALSDQMTSSAKERRIASIVRITIAKAIGASTDPADALDTAVRLTETAVRLAPEFADAIASAVSLAPAVARMDAGASQIRAAALAAATGSTLQTASVPRQPFAAVKPARKRQASSYDVVTTDSRMDRQEALTNKRAVAAADDPFAGEGPDLAELKLGEDALFDLTLAVGLEHDDNIFLTATDEENDTIFRVTPGLGFRFGRDTLMSGALSYRHSFVRYSGNAAPSVSLGAGSAQFGFNNGRVSLTGAMTFQQLNQNTRETVGLSEPFIHRDVFGLVFNAETALTAKTSVSTGANFNSTDFKNHELVGTRETEIPLKFYFALTPKTSLSAGTSYRTVKPRADVAGDTAQDMFHNIGLRGTLAPKVTGELSVGYRTRKTDQNPTEKLWGFDGSLSLELTPKSNLALLLNRDFSVGPLGESLQSNRSTLRFSASPTDQWTLGAAVSHHAVNYGEYSLVDNPSDLFRSDKYWESSLSTSYLFTNWFTASAEYTLRRNNSSVPEVEFSNNVLNLNLGFKY